MSRAITDQTQTRQFKEWFGKSKVVDRSGKPRVVYHGTPNGEFTEFDKEMVGSTWNADEIGFFFTSAKSLAEDYTKPYFKESSANPHLLGATRHLCCTNEVVVGFMPRSRPAGGL